MQQDKKSGNGLLFRDFMSSYMVFNLGQFYAKNKVGHGMFEVGVPCGLVVVLQYLPRLQRLNK